MIYQCCITIKASALIRIGPLSVGEPEINEEKHVFFDQNVADMHIEMQETLTVDSTSGAQNMVDRRTKSS